MNNTIFLTGATGLVGGHLLARMLHQDKTARIVALVRSDSENHARQRLENAVKRLGLELSDEDFERIQLVVGDITEDKLGISTEEYDELARQVTHVIHSAASVEFTLSLEEVRKVNTEGTKTIMAFAKRANAMGSLCKVAYISTAYVSGMQTGRILEDSDHEPTEFSNTYERAKYEADSYVRSLMAELPIMVFRPSIIVGDSQNGRTSRFNVLYPMTRLLCKGDLRFIPGSADTKLDVVPVDFVADAIHHIFFRTDGVGKVYNLTSGADAPTLREVTEEALSQFRIFAGVASSSRPRFIRPTLYRMSKNFLDTRQRRLCQSMEIFEPYLMVQRTFDNSNTRQALEGSGIVIPRFAEYGKIILRYAVETNWGKQLRRAA